MVSRRRPSTIGGVLAVALVLLLAPGCGDGTDDGTDLGTDLD